MVVIFDFAGWFWAKNFYKYLCLLCFCIMKKYGFTFIEIMITIVVFSIWVFAVLGLVTSNLRWVERNDLRLQGTLLAKEWLELVYNLRDSNLDRELPRNCILASDIFWKGMDGEHLSYWITDQSDQCVNQHANDEDGQAKCIMDVICPHYFGITNPIKVSYSDSNYVFVNDTNTTLSWNRLYIHTGSKWELWYSHEEDGGQETFFSRYITFDSIGETVSEKPLDADKILKVSSHVLWEKWSYTGEVVLESFIWNY